MSILGLSSLAFGICSGSSAGSKLIYLVSPSFPALPGLDAPPVGGGGVRPRIRAHGKAQALQLRAGLLRRSALPGRRDMFRDRSCHGSACHGLAALAMFSLPHPASCQLHVCKQHEQPGNWALLLTRIDFPVPGPGSGEMGWGGARQAPPDGQNPWAARLPGLRSGAADPQPAVSRKEALHSCVPQAPGPLLRPREPAVWPHQASEAEVAQTGTSWGPSGATELLQAEAADFQE